MFAFCLAYVLWTVALVLADGLTLVQFAL